MQYCKLYPTININGEEQVSELWQQLLTYTHNDRTAAKVLYAGLTSDKIKSVEGLEYNNQGQVTLDSAKKALNLEIFINPDAKLRSIKRSLGAIDENGNYIEYAYTGKIADKIEEFNKKDKDHVATIHTKGRVSTIEVLNADENTEYIKKDYAFKNQLCKNIQNFLESKGFGLRFLSDNAPYAGLFSPDAILNTEQGLRDVIAIAKGERGERALIEEFGHLLVYGLSHTPIVKRLINNLLTPVDGRYLAIQSILGDQYDEYVKTYTDGDTIDFTRLAYEAAGKLMFEQLQAEQAKNSAMIRAQFSNDNSSDSVAEGSDNVVSRFIKRIWNSAKELVKSIQPTDITEIVNSARLYAGYIAAEFQHNGEGLNKYFAEKNLLKAKTLYDIDGKIDQLQRQAQYGVDLLKRKMRIAGYNRLVQQYGEEEVNKWYVDKLKSEEALKEGNAQIAILNVLQSVSTQLSTFDIQLQLLKRTIEKDPTNYGNITKMATFLNDLKSTIVGFSPYIRACKTLDDLISEDTVKPDQSFIDQVKTLAANIESIISNMETFYSKNARQTLRNFIAPHFKEYEIDLGKGKTVKVTIDMILDLAEQDSNIIDRYIRGMSRSRDPLLNIANEIAEGEIQKVNMQMVTAESIVRNMTKELEDAGYDSSFIYERNEKGELTGRIISEYNWDKYYEDLETKKAELKARGVRGMQYYTELQVWHTEHSAVEKVLDMEYTVPNDRYKKPLTLAPAQEKYWRQYKKLKAAADELIDNTAEKPLNLYNAVQKRRDDYQAKKDKLTSGSFKKSIREIKEDYLNEYKTLVDDHEYKHRSGLTDFSGRPLKEVPMYYVDQLEDMNKLMTDGSSAILAYTHMAYNYKSMKNLLQNFLLLQDWVDNYRETKTGETRERQPDGTYKVEQTKAVLSNSNTSAILDNFIQTNLLDNRKDIESVRIGKWQVNIGKIADKILRYNSLARISANIRVDIGNRVSAAFNQWFEAVGGQYYGKKGFADAGITLYKLLPQYTMNSVSATKDDFLSLFLKKYDIMEDYESSVENAGIRWGKVSRTVGASSWYLGQRIGELFNHVPSAIAMMRNVKVLDENGNETNLFDQLEIVKAVTDEGYEVLDLLPKEGTKDLDGHQLRNGFQATQYLTMLNVDTVNKIHSINQSINGAFRTINRGAINRKWMGRAAMQFRQWMVDYYDSRFSGGYYDARLGEWRESTYVGGYRYLIKSISDHWKNHEYLELFKLSNLNKKESYLVKKLFAEAAAFVFTGLLAKLLLTMFTDSDDDGKHRWKTKEGELADNMFLSPEAFVYGCCRMFLMQTFVSHRDLGATFPNPGVFDNFNGIFKNMFPSQEAFADFANILNPWLLGETVDHKRDPLGVLMFSDKYLYNLEVILWPQLKTWNKTLRTVADDSMLDYQQYMNSENIFY